MLHITSCDYADNPTYGQASHDPLRYVGMPLGTRCHRIVYVSPEQWVVWIATNDCVYGTYLVLSSNGGVIRVTSRVDEGDEVIEVKPPNGA